MGFNSALKGLSINTHTHTIIKVQLPHIQTVTNHTTHFKRQYQSFERIQWLPQTPTWWPTSYVTCGPS